MTRFVAVLVVACGCGVQPFPGAPTAGTACTAAQPECVTSGEVAMCEGSKWAVYACPSECRNLQAKRCDWSQAIAGDECPKSWTADTVVCRQATTGLKCMDGKFTAVECPMGCEVFGGDFGTCHQ